MKFEVYRMQYDPHYTAVQDELRGVIAAAATSISPPRAKGAKGMLPWQVDVTI